MSNFAGFAAEMAIANLISEHRKLKPLWFSTPQIIEVARCSPLGLQRLEAAEPHLKARYGVPTKNGETLLIWESVPPRVLMDLVLGIDAGFMYLGWNYGLDVTTNPDALEGKRDKLTRLRPSLRQLGFDRIGVLLVRSDSIDPSAFFKGLPRNENFCFSV